MIIMGHAGAKYRKSPPKLIFNNPRSSILPLSAHDPKLYQYNLGEYQSQLAPL